ncbi:MAG: FHA domain-containing protein, partial [bacterium]|nr:FHA domain-containing protein [bacterium]
MEKGYTEAIDVNSYKRSSENLGLLIVSQKDGITDIDLNQFRDSRLYIGRNVDKCDIVLDSSVVSGVHGKIKRENGCVYFADLDSTNGSYIMSSGRYIKLKKNRYVGPLREGMMFLLGGKNKKEVAKETILMIVTGGKDGKAYRKYPLFEEEYVIGKDKDCDIVFSHPAVSHKHARVFRKNGKAYVEDLNSTNGVFVNGIVIHGTREIHEKDIIQIGLNLIIYSCETLLCKTETDGIQLTMDGLVKKVDHGKKTILSNVNCTIESNDFVAIVGGSGAGKSTLLKTLGGYDKFYEG